MMTVSKLVSGLPLPAPFLESFRTAIERIGDGPLSPAIDLFTRSDTVVARVALPGVTPQNVEVTVGDDMVTISGSSEGITRTGDVDVIHEELNRGSFRRSFWLPAAVAVDGAIATLKDGLLTLILPKTKKPTGRVAKVEIS